MGKKGKRGRKKKAKGSTSTVEKTVGSTSNPTVELVDAGSFNWLTTRSPGKHPMTFRIRHQKHLTDKTLPFTVGPCSFLVTDQDSHTLPDDCLFWVPFPNCIERDPWSDDIRPDLEDESTPNPTFFVGEKMLENDDIVFNRTFTPTGEMCCKRIETLAQLFDKQLFGKMKNDALSCTVLNHQPPGYVTYFASKKGAFVLTLDWRHEGNGPAIVASDSRSKKHNFSHYTCFKAALAVGDIHSCHVLFQYARKQALQIGNLPEWADAMWRFTRMVAKADYPTVVNDVIYYSVETGEMFNRLPSKSFPRGKRCAIAAYKFGAMFGYSRPDAATPCMYTHSWNCLAIALKRILCYDMAERAYRHALHSSKMVVHSTFREESPGHSKMEHNMFHCVLASFFNLSQCRNEDVTKTRSSNKAAQRKENKTHYGRIAGLTHIICAQCGQELTKQDGSKCSGCKMVHYCNAECQRIHWKEHKVACKVVQNQKKDAKRKQTLPREVCATPLLVKVTQFVPMEHSHTLGTGIVTKVN